MGSNQSYFGKCGDDCPVERVSWDDAKQFVSQLSAKTGKTYRLPTEAEWEWAAGRGKKVPGRARPIADGKPSGNNWDGVFPEVNTRADGFLGRAPVASFPADENGLYDMTGNAWEWTSSTWRASHQEGAATNAKAHAIKGGSFLCAHNFCARYRPQSRQMQEDDLGTNHVGFRTVRRIGASG